MNKTLAMDLLTSAMRIDFRTFLERAFRELNPTTEFKANWHLDVLAYELEQVRLGINKRLIVCVPPRSLKSHCASVAFPAYLLGRDPSSQIICVSYAQDLADKFANDCRTLMQSSIYKSTFPGTRLSSQRPPLQDLQTTKQGFRMATSVGGVLTGFGANFLIIDDALKPQDAFSESARKLANDWFSHTLLTRLNNQKEGRIVLVMQRLHEDDLVGHLLDSFGPNDVRVISFPSVAQEDESFTITSPLEGTRTYTRKRGDLLHPEREGHAELNRLREQMGPYNFSAQYLQSPTPLDGGMIKEPWFRRYSEDERHKFRFSHLIQSWDTANKVTELSDYSVCTTWGITVDPETGERNFYLLDVFRAKLDYPALRQAVLDQRQRFQAWTVMIEDKASGTQLIQDLRPDGWGVARYHPRANQDKVMRMHAACGVLASGHVHLPEKASWLTAFLNELKAFPHARYDDQVDSMSQVIDWFSQEDEKMRRGTVTFSQVCF
jgi:predicted phage terminase large subunit-like protein